MTRAARLVFVACLALVLTWPGRAGGQELSSPAPPGRSWPRAFVVVFERRVPVVSVRSGPAGVQLARLREATIRMLTSASGLRPGDHVFLFADGITGGELRCLLAGGGCGQPDVDWSSPGAAATFLSHMLRLPSTSGARPAAPVVNVGAAQFVHIRYAGDSSVIDCAVRRHITAPMTVRPASAVGEECPDEGTYNDPNAARAISRVDISFPAQLSAARSRLGPGVPLTGLTWMWALLAERNFDREHALQGMRLDFGAKAGQVIEYYEAATRQYVIGPARGDVPAGPYVVRRDIESLRSNEIFASLASASWLVDVNVGRAQRLPLAGDVAIERGWIDRRWRPAIDALAFDLALAPAAGGVLLDAQLITPGGAVPPSSRNGGRFVFGNSALEAAYVSALEKPARGGTSFRLAFDLLVSGPSTDTDRGLAPIARAYRTERRITVGQRPLGGWELALLVGFVVLSAGAIFVAWRTLRPLPFHVHLESDTIEWRIPGDGHWAPHQLPVAAFTSYWHRRRMRTFQARLTWRYWAPQDLPALGSIPVGLQVNARDVPVDTEVAATFRMRLGSRRSRAAVPLPMTLTFQREAIDARSLTRARTFECLVMIDVTVEPAGPGLPLLPTHDLLYLRPSIAIDEEAPQPSISLAVDTNYRRLGLDLPAGSKPLSFATLTVSNQPSHRGGMARTVRVKSLALVSPECKVPARAEVRATPPTGDEGLVPVPNGGEQRWRLYYEPPQDWRESRKTQLVSGHVGVTWTDDGDASPRVAMFPWQLRWLPAHAATVVGFDLGTSGVRIVLTRSDSLVLDTLTVPMGAVNLGDPSSVEEFPSAVAFGPTGRVVRAGMGRHGIPAEASGNYRLVTSVKGQVLRALARSHDAASRDAALRDMEGYLAAVAASWNAVPATVRGDCAKFIVTVPWVYGDETIRWYTDLVGRLFEGAALVTPLREAEAAAYFDLLRRNATRADNESRFISGRDYRCLVIDLGAGTTDYALVSVSVSPRSDIVAMQTIAHTYALCGGDRYDEFILEFIGLVDPGRLAQDGALREDVRRFKEQSLPRMLNAGQFLVTSDRLGDANRSAAEFFAFLDAFFVEAIRAPLEQLAASLPPADRRLDEVLLAGRGILAPGCEGRVRDEVRRLFDPVGAVRPISPNAPQGVVARGAVIFERDGSLVVGDSDLAAHRDVALLADLGGRPEVRWLARQGDEARHRSADVEHAFEAALRQAWVIAGEPYLSEETLAGATFSELRTGGEPTGARILATRLFPAGCSRMSVRLVSDEHAVIEETW